MRAGLGLLSLLICGLIVAYLWTNSASTATSALKTAQPTINRVTSKGPDGASSAQSANLIPYEPGGKLVGLKVVTVTPGGAMATTYGLAPGDIILQIYGFKIGDSSSTESFEASKDFLFIDAYRAQWPILVNRGGSEITLPAQRNFTVSPPPAKSLPAPSGVEAD